MTMKNRSSQPNGVENGSNMSQSVPNIKINHQNHILDLNNVYRGRLKKAPWNPLPKKIFPYVLTGAQGGPPKGGAGPYQHLKEYFYEIVI